MRDNNCACLVVMSLVVALCMPLRAQGPPSAEAVRGTPMLDGKLDDSCWAADKAISAFVIHRGKSRPNGNTRAWVAHDDANLYVAFHCPHARNASLLTKARRHDDRVWLDDSVEVYLCPHLSGVDYFHVCVNSLGVVYDERRRDMGWDSGARTGAACEDDAWSVELAIPFDNLDIDFETGHAWGLNLVRNDRVRGLVLTWSPGGFHNPHSFGKVRLRPNLSMQYRSVLAKRTEVLRKSRQRLLGEAREVGLSGVVMAKVLAALSDAQKSIETLAAMAAGETPLPEGGWSAVKRVIEKTSSSVLRARSAAISALFKSSSTTNDDEFLVVIAHPLQKVRRTWPIDEGMMARRVQLQAARDETESFQLVVVPKRSALAKVTVHASPLKGPAGALPVAWRRVGYVKTAKPRYPAQHVGWWPDPLMPPGAFDVAAGEVQPVWFSVTVPATARPGLYKGQATIRHETASVSVPVQLRVRDFRLPRPGTLAAPFGLYRNELAEWWYGKQWRKMPIETYARWCEFLGQYRLTPKNIGRDYIARESDKAGLRVDMSALHKTVGKLASRYYPPYSFCLFRLPNGGTVGRIAEGSSEAATKYLSHYVDIVRTYGREWQRQKLPGKVYIYGCDEPHPAILPFLRKAYEEIHKAVPGYPIMQTRGPSELVGVVDIWCPLTPKLLSPFYAERRKAGDTLWAYVCCSPRPPYANFFVDQPATAHRVLFWQVRKAGATGLLYYCVCAWRGLPNAASGGKCFPDVPIHLKDHWIHKAAKVNGDGLLVYPGRDMTPIPSIRLEVIRDGIEDYEYLALLSRLVAKAKTLPTSDRPPAPLMRQAEELCTVPESISRSMTDYTADPQIVFDQRRKIADMIELLTDEQR